MSQRGGLKTSVEVCVHTPVCVCRYVTKKHWLRAGRVKLPKRRKSIEYCFMELVYGSPFHAMSQ